MVICHQTVPVIAIETEFLVDVSQVQRKKVATK
jgi:hypothetical protein